jgi:hypothetical protein
MDHHHGKAIPSVDLLWPYAKEQQHKLQLVLTRIQDSKLVADVRYISLVFMSERQSRSFSRSF